MSDRGFKSDRNSDDESEDNSGSGLMFAGLAALIAGGIGAGYFAYQKYSESRYEQKQKNGPRPGSSYKPPQWSEGKPQEKPFQERPKGPANCQQCKRSLQKEVIDNCQFCQKIFHSNCLRQGIKMSVCNQCYNERPSSMFW